VDDAWDGESVSAGAGDVPGTNAGEVPVDGGEDKEVTGGTGEVLNVYSINKNEDVLVHVSIGYQRGEFRCVCV
jgi:hypothetical protein